MDLLGGALLRLLVSPASRFHRAGRLASLAKSRAPGVLERDAGRYPTADASEFVITLGGDHCGIEHDQRKRRMAAQIEFTPGQIVFLKSDPELKGAVVAVLPGKPENRVSKNLQCRSCMELVHIFSVIARFLRRMFLPESVSGGAGVSRLDSLCRIGRMRLQA